MVVPALVNALLGLLGIALARRQRRQSRLMFWLMTGSGIVLCMPLALLLSELASAFHLIGGSGRHGSSFLAEWRFLFWMKWLAYALLFLGFVRLRIAQRRAATDIDARRPAGEPVSTQRSETATIEAVVGGAMVTLLIGLIGILVGSAQAAAMGSMSELGAFMPVAGGFFGLVLGLAVAVVAGRRASRSGIGAHPRFWLPVLAAFFGALASEFVLTFVLPSLLSRQPYASRYGYYNSSISQLALVFPFVCGLAGYLVSLRTKRGFTGWFVLGCLLLTLAAVTALPINAGRRPRMPNVAIGPSFLRYPGATARPGPQYTRVGTGTAFHFETEDSRESVIDFYEKTLARWKVVPAQETGSAMAFLFEGNNSSELVTIRFENGTTGKTWFTLIYATYPSQSRESLAQDSIKPGHLPRMPR